MTNVIDMRDYRAPTTLPRSPASGLARVAPHADARRAEASQDPFYHQRQGRSGNGATTTSRSRPSPPVAAVVKGSYSVGLAMRASGLVAVDFDDCVRDGVINERVLALCEGTSRSPWHGARRASLPRARCVKDERLSVRERRDGHGRDAGG